MTAVQRVQAAIDKAIKTKETIHCEVEGQNIFDLVGYAGGADDWEFTTEKDGSFDVYSVDRKCLWRLKVTGATGSMRDRYLYDHLPEHFWDRSKTEILD